MRHPLLTMVVVAALSPLTLVEASARYASVVMDADTGRVLHAINPDVRRFPASLVKMMTLYMTFDALKKGKLKSNQWLKVSRVAAGRSPSRLGLKRGERIRVKDVIGALVTKSANDAATVVAEAIGGTERRFGRMMTAKARQLGMKRTTFRNASGLPHYAQRSTARDMAILARALVRNFPQHYGQFSRETFVFRGRTYRNHNRLMKRYGGMDGLKTGYIRSSGYNLAASAMRDGRRVIAVVFGGKSPRWRDRQVARLLDKGFRRLPPKRNTLVAAAPRFVPAPRSAPRFVPTPRSAPLPTPRPSADAPDNDGERGWAIQVGAFSQYAPAHLAVTRAARAAKHLTDTRITVVPDENEKGRVYRARLVGLSESLAHSSCLRLQQKNINCIVVPSDSSLAQGSQ